MDRILEWYAGAADALRPRYDAIDPALLYGAVMVHFPQNPSKILDIGAGTGRDAAWLAGFGQEVLAVEPVAALRAGDHALAWRDDRLPELRKTRALGQSFDFILINAVLQHLRPHERAVAMGHIAGLLARGERIVSSLRHGPSADSRPAYPFETGEIELVAADRGLAVLFQCNRQSIGLPNKAAGVHWVYMVLGRAGEA